MNMENYVSLDNLSEAQNNLLNILWDQNREMTLKELTQSINTEFSRNWKKSDIRLFIQALLLKDYIKEKRHNMKTYYMALGCDGES